MGSERGCKAGEEEKGKNSHLSFPLFKCLEEPLEQGGLGGGRVFFKGRPPKNQEISPRDLGPGKVGPQGKKGLPLKGFFF